MITTKSLSYGERTFQICGDLSDGYFDKIEGHVHSNTFLIPLLANHVSSDSTIIDVGANIGLTTVLAHELVPNCRTVSIEPSTAIQGLRQTIAANAITRNVIIDCCVGDSDGEIGFGTVADNTSASQECAKKEDAHDRHHRSRATFGPRGFY